MIVAIASGKGGTGKTTLAVNLALAAGREVQLLDCDVEAPNDHLFLGAELGPEKPVGLPVPSVEVVKCNGCGECSRICQYHAIAAVAGGAVVFPELCHGCGGCTLVCPEDAITEVMRPNGVLQSGRAADVQLITGRLNVGEALVPPLIRAVRECAAGEGLVLVDAPPGSSCSMLAAVRGADYVLLVTEPTPFGLNDLELAVGAVRALGLPCGIVINRADAGDHRVHDYCEREGLEIVLEIPDDRRVAEAYARGLRVVEAVPELAPPLAALAARLTGSAATPAGGV